MNQEILTAIHQAINAVSGTPKNIEGWWEDHFENEFGPFFDLPREYLDYFDSKIARCSDCDWWCPVVDLDDESKCSSC